MVEERQADGSVGYCSCVFVVLIRGVRMRSASMAEMHWKIGECERGQLSASQGPGKNFL